MTRHTTRWMIATCTASTWRRRTTAFVPKFVPHGEAKYDANLLAKRDIHL